MKPILIQVILPVDNENYAQQRGFAPIWIISLLCILLSLDNDNDVSVVSVHKAIMIFALNLAFEVISILVVTKKVHKLFVQTNFW